MRKQLVILVIIVVICLLIIWGIIQLGSSSSNGSLPPWSTGSGLPILRNVTTTPAPTGDQFPIHTSQGDVLVKNFFSESQPLQGYDGVVVKETDDYHILYFTKGQTILITILNTPVLVIREKAEQDLISLLGSSKENICKLKVAVRTIVSVDPDLAGRELGLSFCN